MDERQWDWDSLGQLAFRDMYTDGQVKGALVQLFLTWNICLRVIIQWIALEDLVTH